MSWYEAQSYCRKSYTDLVSIRVQNQNEAVKVGGLTSSTSFWIGLLRDDWEWTDGGRSAYRNWVTGHPPSSSDCVVLRRGKWSSALCNNAQPALCSNTLIHVSAEQMDWESALDYCQRENRRAILRIESDLDQKEVKFELRRRRVSGNLWVGLGQSQLSELLKSSSRLSLGPWTKRNERQAEPAPLSRAGTDTVETTFRTKTDVSALRAVCELKQP
ncbi:C-type mannose receptor 2-like [Pygocentrus nattereri]|uniref:C-type lectin domain-containing protein n=1 Tax=Pygocentrus nattereri TaxID=42514 RepID=A0A3B4BPV6_PYGNA|nr:C-type mannose receptor 2-like [Pygocentrus nattereri]